jgi:threonine/homoserine/homoserine lactone efflux protein
MTAAFFEGVFLGITLAFLVGPSFIALVQTSINEGFINGVKFSMGIALSDLTLIALSYLGALQLIQNPRHQVAVGIVGGFILVAFGVYTYTRKQKIVTSTMRIGVNVNSGKFLKYISKGYVLNIFNPFLLVFWLGVVGVASGKYGIQSREMILFFTGTISAVVFTDVIKCFVAHKIKKYLNLSTLTIINRVVGILLVGFGILLIIRTLLSF